MDALPVHDAGIFVALPAQDISPLKIVIVTNTYTSIVIIHIMIYLFSVCSMSCSKKKGGWEKLKAAKEKEKTEQAIAKSTPNLFTYFSSKRHKISETDTDLVEQNPKTSAASHPDVINQNEASTSTLHAGHQIVSEIITEVTEIPSCDPGKWNIDSKDEKFLSYWCEKGPKYCQNWNSDFSATKRAYSKQSRYLTKAMFEYEKPNKEIGKREWLLYSPFTHKVYCFYCCLFAD